MVVPVFARSVAAAVGAVLVIAAWVTVVGNLIVPRQVGGRLNRWTHPAVLGTFRLATAKLADYDAGIGSWRAKLPRF